MDNKNKQPFLGQLVLYHVHPNDVLDLRNNYVDTLPAIIVRVWDETLVNLKVFTDGNVDIWKTSIAHGNGPGEWDELQ